MNRILLLLTIAFVLFSCDKKNNSTEEKKTYSGILTIQTLKKTFYTDPQGGETYRWENAYIENHEITFDEEEIVEIREYPGLLTISVGLNHGLAFEFDESGYICGVKDLYIAEVDPILEITWSEFKEHDCGKTRFGIIYNEN